jgi:hypothetical protein
MLRRIAQFLLWLGLFGVFLFAAAYSTGVHRFDLLLGSAGLILLSALILRRPRAHFEPSHRFRTLRRLGLLGRGEEDKTN